MKKGIDRARPKKQDRVEMAGGGPPELPHVEVITPEEVADRFANAVLSGAIVPSEIEKSLQIAPEPLCVCGHIKSRHVPPVSHSGICITYACDCKAWNPAQTAPEPSQPPQPTRKPKKPRKPRTTAWERDGRMVGRYPPGTTMYKKWTGSVWNATLGIGDGPHKGLILTAESDGSFAAEEQLGKLWLDYIRSQEGKS